MAANEQVRRSGALTRVAVLDAAERLFAARGYRGTSLEEIGREAGLSRGTPGYFFGSKQRLYGEVLDRHPDPSAGDARGCEPGHPGREPARARASRGPRCGAPRRAPADPTLVRLIQWETLEGHGQILGAIGAQTQAFVELIQSLGESSGVRKLDETTATELLICATAMCWFPLAHADAMERTFHRDPHSAAGGSSAGENRRRVHPHAARGAPSTPAVLAVSELQPAFRRSTGMPPVSGMPCHLAGAESDRSNPYRARQQLLA